MAKDISAFGSIVGSFDLVGSSLELSAAPTGMDLSVYATVSCKSVRRLYGLCGWVVIETGKQRNGRDAWVAPATGNFLCTPDAPADVRLVAVLDERTVERVERDRLVAGTDVTFRFWLSLIAETGNIAQVGSIVDDVQVPRSKWGDLLRTSEFGAALLHRFPPVSFGARFTGVVERFRAAERSLLNGDYDSAVGSCRAALDHLADVANIGTKFDKPSGAKVFATIADSQVRDAFEAFVAPLRGLLNRGAHPGTAGYEAAEARYVVGLTAATLHYLGERLPRPSA